jgi:ligand-binding sensor domain-containing protein
VSICLNAFGQSSEGVPPAMRYRLSAAHFTGKTGLTANSVWGIMQDQQGFMWFTVNNGLNRYDGKNFKFYNKKKYGRLPYQSSDGTLWLSTQAKGLKSFHPKTGKLVSYRHHKNKDEGVSIGNNQINCIYEITPEHLWVNTAQGLNVLKIKNGQIVSNKANLMLTKEVQAPKDRYLRSIYKDLSGNVWGLFNNDIYQFSTTKPTAPTYLQKYTIAHSLLHKPRRIYEDAQGRFWLGTETGVGTLNPTTGCVDFKGLKNQAVFVIYQDSRNTLWVGTNRGLYWLDEQTGRFVRFESQLQVLGNLGDLPIMCMYEDNSGSLWIGTAGHGLYQLETKSRKFSLRQLYLKNGNGFNKKLSFWHIATGHKNLLWLQTLNNKLLSFDYLTGQTKFYTHQPNNPQSISHRQVSVIYKDNANRVWVGTRDGVNLINEHTGEFKRYYPAIGKNNYVNQILEDAQRHVIVQVRHQGLYKYNQAKDSFEPYFAMHHIDKAGEYKSKCKTMLIDKKGTLWTLIKNRSTVRLDLIDLASRKKAVIDFKDSTNIHGITYIYESNSGQIWLASYGGGLIKVSHKTKEKIHLKYYQKQHGLANEFLYGILEDAEGNLWLSHDQGLSKFDPTVETFNNYTVNDGIQDAEFMESAFAQTQDGQMFFGGGEGLTAFYPREIVANAYIPPIVLTDFKVYDQSVDFDTPNTPLTQGVTFTKKLCLTYQQARSFSFEFNALSYIHSEQNQYKTKLDNYDVTWQNLGKRNFITYTNIPPGKYIFRVQGANYDGAWNPRGLSIEVIILPAWWQTWWFRLGVISTVLLLIWVGYRARISGIKKQKRELEHQVMLRTQEVMTQKEEISTQLDAIAEQSKRISQSIRAAKTIQEAILPFDALLQQMLKDYFIIYRPKDVVSGDFYWASQIHNTRILAAIDCTGHGIPGAFMSLIGFAILNDIVNVNQITEPAKILEVLRHSIRDTLQQEKTGGRNGMDMVLVTLEETAHQQTKVCFAGAKRPLWYIEKNSVSTEALSGSNVSIGVEYLKKRFIQNHVLTFESGTLLYLSTDGFPDQNDAQRKRFGSQALMNLLYQHHHLPLVAQQQALEEKLDLYMKGTNQRDDILLMGILL